MGHTIATIFLPRSYCLTYSGYPRAGFCFQQDGALAQRARDTVAFLERQVPDFISPTLWPPNSPDLNPIDYSIWSELQEKVYRCSIANVSASDQRDGTLCPVDRGCCYQPVARCLSACVRGAGHTLIFKHKVSAILTCIYQNLLN